MSGFESQGLRHIKAHTANFIGLNNFLVNVNCEWVQVPKMRLVHGELSLIGKAGDC